MFRGRHALRALLTALITVFVLVGGAPVRAQQISVTVNGDPVAYSGTRPVQINGSVLVPGRGVLEKLGAGVHWGNATQTVTATLGGVSIELHLGDRIAGVSGRAVTLNVPDQSYHGNTMVPLRFLSEALGALGGMRHNGVSGIGDSI